MKVAIVMILSFLALNFVSCLIVRLKVGGKFVVQIPNCPSKSHLPRIFLISGRNSQPARAYERFKFPEFQTAYLRFSYLGYNPRRAGRQLAQILEPNDVVCGLSVGAKAIEYSPCLSTHATILINPCSIPQLLNRKGLKYYIIKLMPLAEIVSYLMWWFAVLPICFDDFNEPTSFALMVDQFFWVGYGCPRGQYHQRTGVVISTKDGLVKDLYMRQHYQAATSVSIVATHGQIAGRCYGHKYRHAVAELLEKISGA